MTARERDALIALGWPQLGEEVLVSHFRHRAWVLLGGAHSVTVVMMEGRAVGSKTAWPKRALWPVEVDGG